jgi:hypothetical protein
MRLAAMLVVLTSLAGCAQYDEMRSANIADAGRQQVAADDAACRPAGVPGTPAYDDCRKRYANAHASEQTSHERLVDQMMNDSAREASGR